MIQLSAADKEEEARALLVEWIAQHAEDVEALRMLRARDEAAGRWDAVAESCAKLLPIETGAEQIATAQAFMTACERAGQPADAIPGLEEVASQQPENLFLLETLMRLYEVAHEHRKLAMMLLDLAEKTADPQQRFAHFTRATGFLVKENETDAALDSIQQALALQPTSREARLVLVDVYLAAGRHDEADELLRTLATAFGRDAASPDLAAVQHKMAWLAKARGDQRGHLEWLKRALDSNRKNGEIAAELADLAEELGERDLAIKALRAVTLLPVPTPAMSAAVAYLRQARIALRGGDNSRAIIFARRALQEEPELEPAQELLREIGESKVNAPAKERPDAGLP
jgi:tetratricopeptide (TPR) repeat protein